MPPLARIRQKTEYDRLSLTDILGSRAETGEIHDRIPQRDIREWRGNMHAFLGYAVLSANERVSFALHSGIMSNITLRFTAIAIGKYLADEYTLVAADECLAVATDYANGDATYAQAATAAAKQRLLASTCSYVVHQKAHEILALTCMACIDGGFVDIVERLEAFTPGSSDSLAVMFLQQVLAERELATRVMTCCRPSWSTPPRRHYDAM